MSTNERWLASLDHRAVVRSAWTLGVLIQDGGPRKYRWQRSEHDGLITFTITVNAEAFRATHEEQAARKGWTMDTLLAKRHDQPRDTPPFASRSR